MTFEDKLNEFVEEYGDFLEEEYNIQNAGLLYSEYHTKVKPYIHLITEHRLKYKVLQDEFAYALDVDVDLFRVMKDVFPDFRLALESKKTLMKFKSHKDLLEAIETSRQDKKPSAKLLELQLKLFDDEFGNKDKNGTELPSKIEVTYNDASVKK